MMWTLMNGLAIVMKTHRRVGDGTDEASLGQVLRGEEQSKGAATTIPTSGGALAAAAYEGYCATASAVVTR
jgi:hypothetical protein